MEMSMFFTDALFHTVFVYDTKHQPIIINPVVYRKRKTCAADRTAFERVVQPVQFTDFVVRGFTMYNTSFFPFFHPHYTIAISYF